MIRARLVHEWGRLRTVLVGRPHYRLPDPLPEEGRNAVSPRVWRAAKRLEGRTLEEAMPTAYAACRHQMDAVVRRLRARGVRVHRVPRFRPDEEAYLRESAQESNLLFPRDPLLVVGSRVLELEVRPPHRRKERAPVRRALRRLLGDRAARIVPMPVSTPPDRTDEDGAFLDGGDCLVADGAVYVGVAPGGTTPGGVAWLRAALGPRVRVETVRYGEGVPHLDCALCFVRRGLGLLCPDDLPDGPPADLRGWTWIEIGREEARRFAANALPLDPRTLLLPEGVERVADALRHLGHGVETVPFDHVTAFGGGLRCWAQAIERAG